MMLSTSDLLQWLMTMDRRYLGLVLAIVGLPIARSWINAWRLRKLREKYPHMIKLEVQAKKPKHKFTLQSGLKKLQKGYHQFCVPFGEWTAATFTSLFILPTVFFCTSTFAFTQATIQYTRQTVTAVWEWLKQQSVKLFAKPKPKSVLRKPKAERLQEAAKSKQPLKTNKVQFDWHSGQDKVRSEQFYFNPQSEPCDRVPAQPSRTPPRPVIDDPEEIGKRLTQRPDASRSIKDRIQTPPPKRRQKPRLPEMMNKENAEANAAKAVPPKIPRQPDWSASRPKPQFQPVSTPRNGLTTPRNSGTPMMNGTPANNLTATPRPFLYSSQKEPLSAQVRKRRMAGETLFSHTPQETTRSLELESAQKEPKRRRLLTVLPNNHKRYFPLKMINKREREEEILKEFNRKRVKDQPSTVAAPANTAAATPNVTGTPAFAFGKDSAAPPSDAKLGFSFTPAAPATTPGTTPAPGDSKPAADPNKGPAFNFNAAATPAPAGTPAPPASGQPPATATPPAAATPGFQFGNTTPAVPATATPGATTPGSTFNFNAGATAAAAPAGAAPAPAFQLSKDAGTPAPAGAAPTPGFQFGKDAGTPAPAGAAPAFQFAKDAGASTTPAPATGATPGFSFTNNAPTSAPVNANAPAPGGFSFGNNNPIGTTPAPTTGGFSFGNTNAPTNTPAVSTTPAATATTGFGAGFGSATPAAAKPDPPAANASEASKPSFAFGATANHNTPGAATAAPAFGATNPNPPSGSFMSPPASAFGQNNNNAGSTPGMQFGGGSTTPGAGFGQQSAPATGGGFGGGQPPAFGGANTGGGFQSTGGFQASQFANPPTAGGTPGFQSTTPSQPAGFKLGGTAGTASARRRNQRRKGKARA